MERRGADTVEESEPRKGKRRRRAPGAAADDPAGQGDQNNLQLQDSGSVHTGAGTHSLQVNAAARLAALNAAQAAAAAAAAGPSSAHQEDPPQQDESHDGEEEDSAAVGAAIPDINYAAQKLANLTGISEGTALTALKETQEEVFGAGADNDVDRDSPGMLETWVMAAQVKLMCDMEMQTEIAEVRTAMEESLQEYEAVKAADNVPLVERPPDYLRDFFLSAATGRTGHLAGAPASIVFRHITSFVCHRALLAAGSHKAAVIKLAELECKCHRWYPTKGTMRFWQQIAEDCTAAAVEETGAPLGIKLDGWIGCDEAVDGCTVCAAALGKSDRDGGAGPSTYTAPPPPAAAAATGKVPPRTAVSLAVREAVLTALGVFSARKALEVEHEVYKMPSVPGQIPEVFTALDDPPGEAASSDVEFVEVLSGSPGGKRARIQAVEI